jgi:hypothetical protein
MQTVHFKTSCQHRWSGSQFKKRTDSKYFLFDASNS